MLLFRFALAEKFRALKGIISRRPRTVLDAGQMMGLIVAKRSI
jgi:hypothetical protein